VLLSAALEGLEPVDQSTLVRKLREPRSAAVAGLAFGLILSAVLLLLQSAAPPTVADSGRWIEDLADRQAVVTALTLIPFAGIAFLWFVAVVRSQLGQRDDRFFETLFLGSGLLFVAMLFASAAVLGSELSLVDAGVPLAAGAAAQSWSLAAALLGQFGARMAAVFTLAVSTAAVRLGSLPRWLAALGYVTGALLLLTPPLPRWGQLLFPFWVMSISVLMLIRARRSSRGGSPEVTPFG
jgi:hypothetical protein